MKLWSQYYNNVNKYFSKHVVYCSFVHAIAGIGMGVIIARPFDGGHPLQIGIALIVIATVAHIYPVLMKMK